MEILYAVSPIGLGHASRAVAIGLKLRELGSDPQFASGGIAANFIRSYGFEVHDIITEPVPSERDGVMRYPSLWYLRYWRGYRSSRSKMLALVTQLKPDVIVGDEEFSSLSIAVELRLKNVMITDELALGFAKSAFSRYIEGRVLEWYTQLQRSVSHLLVPDYGSDHGNVHFMTPAVRTVTSGRREVLRSLDIGDRERVILLSASGSGIGRFLLDSTLKATGTLRIPDAKLVVVGLRSSSGEDHDNARYLGTYRDNQNLIAAADLVISTAGKSTIDESESSGTPMIAIPIKNHSEQERNAAALGFTHEDRSRLLELIPENLGKRHTPRDYQGATTIAKYISSAT